MEKLRRQLDELIAELADEAQLRQKLESLVSVYPFNEFEYVIATLLGSHRLTLNQYHELRDAYISRNMYLYIFEISAPRTFGEGQLHLTRENINDFEPCEVKGRQLLQAIRDAYKRQTTGRQA